MKRKPIFIFRLISEVDVNKQFSKYMRQIYTDIKAIDLLHFTFSVSPNSDIFSSLCEFSKSKFNANKELNF